MTEKKFEFGPLQTKWLDALESGQFLQTDGELRAEDSDGKMRYCCLGVANEVCQLGENWNDPVLEDTFSELGLFDSNGSTRKGVDLAGELHYKLTFSEKNEQKRTLTQLNDNGASFREIARILRAHPEDYFKESK